MSAIIPTVLFAQLSPIETDRPDQTETPVLTPQKYLQSEIGFNYQKNTANAYEFIYPTILSKYGINKRFEFRLITTIKDDRYKGINRPVNKRGVEPVEIGGKISLFEEKKLLPKTSLIFHVALPKVAHKPYKLNKAAPNFRFTMQHSLTNNLALGYNLGAEWDGFSNKPTYIYTVTTGINIGKKGYAYAEAFGFINNSESPQHSIDGGLAYNVTNDFKLDISGGFGISTTAPVFYSSIGVSFRFKALR